MSFRIAELDVARPSGTLALSPDDEGIALVIRRKARPVGFVMTRLRPEHRSRPFDLRALIDEPTSARILIDSLREELELDPDPGSFAALSLTVAICTKDRPDRLERCLQSLARLDAESMTALGSFEILVIDNASSDDRTRDVVRRRPSVRYVFDPRPGLNFARNRALREACGRLIAFLDDDVVVDAGWLRGLARAWADAPTAALFTGQVLPLELETDAQVLFEEQGGFRRGFEREHFGAERRGDSFYPCDAGLLGTGANMAVDRHAVLALGGFDEALDTGPTLPGGGDLDIFYRLVRAGHPAVYEPSYLVFHQHRHDMRGLRRQYRDSWGAAFMAFVAKSYHHDPPMRGRWLRLALWWYSRQLVRGVRGLGARDVRALDLILNEAAGGALGLLGGYGRSQRRVARIARDMA